MIKEVKINLRIDREVWQRFRQLAKREDLSASQKIRRFIREELSRDPDSTDPGPSDKPRGRRSRRKGE